MVNILADGSIFVKGDLKYDPANDDDYLQVKAYLSSRRS